MSILFIERQEKRTQNLRHVPLINEYCNDLTVKIYYHIERAFFLFIFFSIILLCCCCCKIVAKTGNGILCIIYLYVLTHENSHNI